MRGSATGAELDSSTFTWSESNVKGSGLTSERFPVPELGNGSSADNKKHPVTTKQVDLRATRHLMNVQPSQDGVSDSRNPRPTHIVGCV